MIPKTLYHSARHDPIKAVPLDRYVFTDGSIALAHDFIAGPLPAEFDRCDAFYLEPPWPAGAKIFDKRAGVGERPSGHAELLARLADTIKTLEKRAPVVVVCSKTMARRLPPPREQRTVPFGRFKVDAVCEALAFGPVIPLDWTSAMTLMDSVAASATWLGDFFAGYGLAAAAARQHSARFVCADYDRQCVGAMALRFA